LKYIFEPMIIIIMSSVSQIKEKLNNILKEYNSL
jgi:hypothetical protein